MPCAEISALSPAVSQGVNRSVIYAVASPVARLTPNCPFARLPVRPKESPISINAITLIVAEPAPVAQRLAAAFGWTVTHAANAFAEVKAGDGAVIWLNVPGEPTTDEQQGVVVHCWVDDVSEAAERARAAGATILREPTEMDFGMESAWARVEGGPIVDLTRPIQDLKSAP